MPSEHWLRRRGHGCGRDHSRLAVERRDHAGRARIDRKWEETPGGCGRPRPAPPGGRNSRDYRRSGGGGSAILRRPWQTQIDLHDRPCRRRRGVSRARVPPFRGRGSAAAALRAASHRTPLSFPIPPPITPITPHYLVLCSYAVRSGYAYPSTLLWVDLLHNKVGPCQNNLAAFQKQVDKVIR